MKLSELKNLFLSLEKNGNTEQNTATNLLLKRVPELIDFCEENVKDCNVKWLNFGRDEKKERIIAIDGGGLRGLYSAIMLSRIETELGYDFIGDAELLAGTSSGSIIAAGLACGYSAFDLVGLFQENAGKIFTPQPLIKTGSGLLFDKYRADCKQKVFEKFFGDKRLCDIDKRYVLITGVDLSPAGGHWKPAICSNLPGSTTSNTKIVDALMASTSVPTYFPIHEIGNSRYCDGGLWANNPSVAAYVSLANKNIGNKNAANIVLLNVGTMQTAKSLKYPTTHMGILRWIDAGIIDLILDMSQQSAQYYMQHILDDRYCVVNTVINKHIPFDDVNMMDDIVDIALKADITKAIPWINEFWDKK